MTQNPVELYARDLSGFTRSLARQLGHSSPSHLKLMNMLARAAGFQNVQHMRAADAAKRRLADQISEPPADHRLLERALRQFDDAGRLRQWPSKRAVQTLALWAIWAALPANRMMSEVEINAFLGPAHRFGDVATLRRSLISCGLLCRDRDGTNYHRIESRPPPEARMLIHKLSQRRSAISGV